PFQRTAVCCVGANCDGIVAPRAPNGDASLRSSAQPRGISPMPLDVVGTGFGRTGTNSLKIALEMLGFGSCHHMFEVRDRPEQIRFLAAAARGERSDWDVVFTGFRSTVDWPSAYFWRPIAAHYPKAKVLLSVRPEPDWLKSIQSTIYESLKNRAQRTSALA